MKIGVLGGTLNPIHFGHLRIAEEARDALGLDRVLVIPAGRPPLKSKGLADFRHRYKMAQLATASNPTFETSDIECDTKKTSFTVDTMRLLAGRFPKAEFYFIIGIEAFLDIEQWKEPEALMGLTNFAIVNRPPDDFGALAASPYIAHGRALAGRGRARVPRVRLISGKSAWLVSVTPLEISATTIRRLVGEGRSVRYLLPEVVELYIMSNGLYRSQY